MSEDLTRSQISAPDWSLAEMEPPRSSPAVLWHKISGRLTPNDIATTIADQYDNPIGIYMGEAPAYWAKILQGRKIHLFAAEHDVCERDGTRLMRSFNQCVKYLWHSRDGAKIFNPAKEIDSNKDAYYTQSVFKAILDLQPGQKTGHMIPPLAVLGGMAQYAVGRNETIHANNMYALRHKGDFTKAANGFCEMEDWRSNDNAWWYVSSDDYHANIAGVEFGNGQTVHNMRASSLWSLRPFIALRAPEL